jgi:hypothetical protein
MFDGSSISLQSRSTVSLLIERNQDHFLCIVLSSFKNICHFDFSIYTYRIFYVSRHVTIGEPLHPTATAHNSPAPRKTTPTSPLRRIRAPLKSCWKGPLPPRRITPTVILADFVLPALCSTTPPRNPRPGSKRQPAPSRIRATPTQVGPHPPLEPRWTDDQAASQPGHPKRRRVNPSLFVSQTPYLDAVMAGARDRLRSRPGRGAPSDRGRDGARRRRP